LLEDHKNKILQKIFWNTFCFSKKNFS